MQEEKHETSWKRTNASIVKDGTLGEKNDERVLLHSGPTLFSTSKFGGTRPFQNTYPMLLLWTDCLS